MSKVTQYYALQVGALKFSCVSSTQKKFVEKLKRAYWSWKGLRPRNSNNMVHFMNGKLEVRVTVEVLK